VGATWILPFVAPMTWLVDLYIIGVPLSAVNDLHGFFLRLIGVAIVATLAGLIIGALVGFPALLLLSSLGINHPSVVAVAGGIGWVGFTWLLTQVLPVLSGNWPRWGIIAGLLGAACGAMASLMSRPDAHR
jgi:hypothetical protein